MDHISDSFLETNVPLLVLIEAAKSGNEKEVKEYAQVFREHANKLVEVSYADGIIGVHCLVRVKENDKLAETLEAFPVGFKQYVVFTWDGYLEIY